MAYNELHITNIKGLKALIQKEKEDNNAIQEALDSLEQRVEGIVTEGGEPNIIDTVKVNGETLTVTDKTVDVIVPTKVSELENDSGYQTEEDVAMAVAKIIDEAPESYETLKEIADWIESHADDAAEMNSAIKANTEDIAELSALIGEIPEGAAADTIVEYIQEVVGDITLGEGNYLTEDDVATDEEIAELIEELFG